MGSLTGSGTIEQELWRQRAVILALDSINLFSNTAYVNEPIFNQHDILALFRESQQEHY